MLSHMLSPRGLTKLAINGAALVLVYYLVSMFILKQAVNQNTIVILFGCSVVARLLSKVAWHLCCGDNHNSGMPR